LYVANATGYYPDKRTISYSCLGNTINKKKINGCGYKGELKIESGEGKLAWKVEFAARWSAFDIRFEAFGKDIMDSVRINDWIASEILGFHHPLHIKYEMFLDKGGKKISKSAGNVLTPQTWLRYGTPQSILLLLYKRIAGTRNVSIDDIPNLMDEYDFYEDIYFENIKEKNKNKAVKLKGIYEYVNNLSPPGTPPVHVPYRILIQQSELFINKEADSIKKICERLKKYGLIKDESSGIIEKIRLAMKWVEDFEDGDGVNFEDDQKTAKMELESKHKKAVGDVLLQLNKIANEIGKSSTNQDSDALSQEIQTIIFTTAKGNNIEPKDFFRLFYRILINAERGPRLGNYMVDLGIRNVINKVEKKCD
jgi:lysyl-tRNA synthetase class 1